LISRGIGDDELASMAASRVIDIRPIAIDANIVRVSKMARIRSWTAAHIKDSSDFSQIVVGHHRGEFVVRERSLPQAVSVGKLHDPGT
jgi:hypothetical protein